LHQLVGATRALLARVRLFIAAWPSPEATRILEGLERPGHDWIRWTPPSSWHVTIRFLGELDGPEEVARCLAESGIASREATSATLEDNHDSGPTARHRQPGDGPRPREGPTGRLVAILGPATRWFSGSRTLYAPVAGLDELARRVAIATSGLGVPPGHFTGHITLARLRGRRPLTPEARRLAGAPLDGSWQVGELLVVSSALTPAGPEYSVVERLRLI